MNKSLYRGCSSQNIVILIVFKPLIEPENSFPYICSNIDFKGDQLIIMIVYTYCITVVCQLFYIQSAVVTGAFIVKLKYIGMSMPKHRSA